MTSYKISVVKTGVNFGFYARVKAGRKLLYTTAAYPHKQAATEAAERWVAKQAAK